MGHFGRVHLTYESIEGVIFMQHAMDMNMYMDMDMDNDMDTQPGPGEQGPAWCRPGCPSCPSQGRVAPPRHCSQLVINNTVKGLRGSLPPSKVRLKIKVWKRNGMSLSWLWK